MKRTILALVTLVLLMSAALALPAWAETITQDGLVVTLTTDKESYDSMNAVNASLTITNTNSYAVKNVSAEITAPDGYVLRGDAEEEHGTLRAGQSQTQETAVYRADYAPKLPKTGDGSHFVLWVVLFILCAAGVCAFAHNPHAKRFLSLLLCTAILAPYALHAVPARAETAESTIAVSKSVKIAGKSVTLTGTVKYTTSAVSKNAVRTMGETPVSDLLYFTKNGEIIITGYKGNSTELVIPSEIDGKPVTNIGTGYWQGISGVKNIKILELPDTVKIITANAFQGCENLESVRFSKALSYIGGGAFVGCTGLKEIDIHTTGDLDIATNVAENGGTFGRCENLEKVTITCGGNLNLNGASGHYPVYTGGGAFENCFNLKEVTLSAQGELYIGDCSFLRSSKIAELTLIAGDRTEIGDSAFFYCINNADTNTHVIIPQEADVVIRDRAFGHCSGLDTITLLNNVVSIGESAFDACGTADDGLTIMGNWGSYVEQYVRTHNASNPNDIIEFVAIEDTCDHSSGRHNTYKDSDSVTRYRLNPEDESSHPKGHQTGDIYTRYCADCGMPIQTDILMWGGFEVHEIVNGVCTKCGYAEKSKKPASIDGFKLEEGSTTIGSTVHVKSGMAYGGDYYLRKVQISVFTDDKHGYYSNVSKEFAYEEATSYYDLSNLDEIAINGTFTCEYHKTEEAFPIGNAMVMVFVSVYNEDGTAGENAFGADAADTVVVSCTHPTYTDVHNANIPIRYTDNKDGKTHIWQNGYDRICNTCHESLGVVYGKENVAEHDYTNGDVCPCGYDRNNCQHTPSKTKLYNRTLFKFLNEKEHESYAIVWDLVCSICGKAYSEEIDYVGDEINQIGKPYDHDWKEGKCEVVGCEYECVHDFVLVVDEQGMNVAVAGSGKWQKYDAIYHVCTEIKYQTECTGCGMRGESEYYPAGWKEEHTYGEIKPESYEIGKGGHYAIGTHECTLKDCGHTEQAKGALEPHVFDAVVKKEYEPWGNRHSIFITTEYYCVCGKKDGGYSFDERVENHVDANNDGICDLCKEYAYLNNEFEAFNPSDKRSGNSHDGNNSDYFGVNLLINEKYSPIVKVNKELSAEDWDILFRENAFNDAPGYLADIFANYVMDNAQEFVNDLTGNLVDLARPDDITEGVVIDACKESLRKNIAVILGQENIAEKLFEELKNLLPEAEQEIAEKAGGDLADEFIGDGASWIELDDIEHIAVMLTSLSEEYEENLELLRKYREAVENSREEAMDEYSRKAVLKALTQLELEYSTIYKNAREWSVALLEKSVSIPLGILTIDIFTFMGFVVSNQEYERYMSIYAAAAIEACIMDGGMREFEIAVMNGGHIKPGEYRKYIENAEYVYVSRIRQCIAYGGMEKEIEDLKKGLEYILREKNLSDEEIKAYVKRVMK